MFELHPLLAENTLPVLDLELCSVRLMDDSRFPWVLLVPRVAGAVELHRLATAEQVLLIRESAKVAKALEHLFSPEKLNVGALGNLVPQLHWHVVARNRSDPCWPGPVWGCGAPESYPPTEGEERAALIAQALGE